MFEFRLRQKCKRLADLLQRNRTEHGELGVAAHSRGAYPGQQDDASQSAHRGLGERGKSEVERDSAGAGRTPAGEKGRD